MTKKDFLTPAALGSGVTCRTLRMPDDKETLGVFNSALLTLLDTWRWEQVEVTDLTVDEAVAMCREVLDAFWSSSECDVPTQPGGAPFIGFDAFGKFQQLYAEGWGEPSGDYTVPPVPPREGGTEEDKRCLAAANAANVLAQLYEELSDAYSQSLAEAEALSNFLAALVLLIGAWLGLAVAAIVAIYRIMFQVVYETVQFVTSDYWTTEFNDRLQCALFECAAVDEDDRVTFDFDCVIKRIANTTDALASPFEVLLFGQVQAMLNVIGADGLNAAGATTAITDADCSECAEDWCKHWEGDDLDYWLQNFGEGSFDGTYWNATPYSSGFYALFLRAPFPAGTNVKTWKINYSSVANGTMQGNASFRASDGTGTRVGQMWGSNDAPNGSFTLVGGTGDYDVTTGYQPVIELTQESLSGFRINWIEMGGTGTNPDGENNCI